LKNTNVSATNQAAQPAGSTAPHADTSTGGHDDPNEAIDRCIRWTTWYVRRLVQAGDIHSKGLNKKYQVSQPQVSCIIALNEYGPLSLSKLAQYILVKPSTVTGIIDRLEQKGLVKRERNLIDRRVITIELTAAGKHLADEAPPPIPETIIRGLKKLTDDEAEQIVNSLSTLVSMLDDETGE
jgi:DNA-binding MarR family transcriptional regulator